MSKLYPERLNRDFENTDKNDKIFEAYMNVLDPPLDESAAEDAKKTLDAIVGALGKGEKDSDIYKRAVSMKKYFDDKGSFSTKQAQWIYNTSKALFRSKK